jgi:5-methylcytosine-specific restriction endonuclease McrA
MPRIRRTPNGPMKVCTGCRADKPTSEYYAKGIQRGQQRIMAKCKDCFRKQANKSKRPSRNVNEIYIDPLGRQRGGYFHPELNCLVKNCRDCKKPTPLDQLQIKGITPSGKPHRVARCPQCAESRNKQYRVNYRAEHQDYFREYNQQYQKEHAEELKARKREYLSREQVKEHHKNWKRQDRLKNREKIQARMQKWLEKHPGYTKERNKLYREMKGDTLREYDRQRSKDPKRKDQLRDHKARRRAQKLGSRIGRIRWDHIIQRDNATCYLCEKKLSKKEITFDHVIPLTRGGPHTEDNLKVACRSCNSRKHNKLLEELDWYPPIDIR